MRDHPFPTQIWSFKTGGLSKEVYSTQLMKIGDILKWSVKKKRWYLNTGFTVLGTCNCDHFHPSDRIGDVMVSVLVL